MPSSPRLTFTFTHAFTAALTPIDPARTFLEAPTLSEQWIERVSQHALLLEAHHTTHIEGTQLTLDEGARLWAGEEVEGADRDDVRELLDYRDAFNLVAESRRFLERGQLGIEEFEALVPGVHRGEGRRVRAPSTSPRRCGAPHAPVRPSQHCGFRRGF